MREDGVVKLLESLVAFVPPEKLEEEIPLVVVPQRIQAWLEEHTEIQHHEMWPYERIEVGGGVVGVVPAPGTEPDLFGITWSRSTPEEREAKGVRIPPINLDDIQYETYLQLRDDGVEAERAAALAAGLHPEGRT